MFPSHGRWAVRNWCVQVLNVGGVSEFAYKAISPSVSQGTSIQARGCMISKATRAWKCIGAEVDVQVAMILVVPLTSKLEVGPMVLDSIRVLVSIKGTRRSQVKSVNGRVLTMNVGEFMSIVEAHATER